MSKDLDWSSVEADAAVMFGKNMTTTELKYQLTEPRLGHNIPERFVEDFFEFAALVHCDLSIVAFYQWYRLNSLTHEEWDVVVEALKAQQALLHSHLEADLQTVAEVEDFTVKPLHKNIQRQSEVLTSMINRFGICPYHKNHVWCVDERHSKSVGHQLA